MKNFILILLGVITGVLLTLCVAKAVTSYSPDYIWNKCYDSTNGVLNIYYS